MTCPPGHSAGARTGLPDLRWMTLDRLRAFVAAVDAGTMSRAAAQMYVSQPAFSQRIGALEDVLGVRLLQRGRHGVSVTVEGAVLYSAARSVLDGMVEVEERVRQLEGGVRGRVHVGAAVSIGSYLVAPHLYAFRKSDPAVEVTLLLRAQGEVEGAVVRGEVDAACLFGIPEPQAPLTVAGVGEIEFVPVVGPGQKWDAGLVMLDESEPARRLVQRGLDEAGLGGLPVLFSAEQPEAVKRYLRTRPGFALLPEPGVCEEVRRGALCRVSADAPVVRVSVSVVYSLAEPTDMIRRVVSCLVAAVSGEPLEPGPGLVDAG